MSGGSNSNNRRRFLIGSTSVVGAAGAVGAAVPFVGSWNPSARARAAGAPVTIDISRLEPGELLGPMPDWRGQPIFVLRRDQEALDNLENFTDHLSDPGSDSDQQPSYAQNSYRSIRPEVGIYVGLCTHLGCSPRINTELTPQEFDPDWKGGFFCSCHGSRFDLAGRVYSGVPAPDNLVVPPHSYETDNIIVIGVDIENS
ncbi:MAG: ubiquinol-cytochrome c reductase iron-sulfur subunit [Pseudohongiellaceae bacterium]